MDDESRWGRVDWDAGVEAPKYVHFYELERRSVTTC
jgi:hypothetical protein